MGCFERQSSSSFVQIISLQALNTEKQTQPPATFRTKCAIRLYFSPSSLLSSRPPALRYGMMSQGCFNGPAKLDIAACSQCTGGARGNIFESDITLKLRSTESGITSVCCCSEGALPFIYGIAERCRKAESGMRIDVEIGRIATQRITAKAQRTLRPCSSRLPTA